MYEEAELHAVESGHGLHGSYDGYNQLSIILHCLLFMSQQHLRTLLLLYKLKINQTNVFSELMSAILIAF